MAKKGYKLSEETKTKMSAAQKGKRLSPETRAKISAVRKGLVLSEEAKAKLSAAHTGKKLSEEQKAKIGLAHTGKKLSEEAKAKISAANKGRHYKLSPEAVVNIAIGQTGHKFHENTREAAAKYRNAIGRKVIINGMPYSSMRAASRALGIRYQDIVIACRYKPERAAEYGLTIDWVENKGE